MNTFDYEGIWKGIWGDMQKYGPAHRHHRRIFSQMFKKISNAKINTIADIGCGEGSNLFFLKTQFPSAKLFGFDVSTTALEAAKANINADFAILDIQKEIPSEKFDLVFCSDVVEHLENDIAAIKNIKHITKQYALIATVQGQMRSSEKSIGHVRNYAYGELRQKLESTGFEVMQTIEWGYPLYSPLYRDFVNSFPYTKQASYGKYNLIKKTLSHILYFLFLLNRSDKGDVIFVMVRA